MGLGAATPALPVQSIKAAVQHYADSFGFKYRHYDGGFAIVNRDDKELHLREASEDGWRQRPEQELRDRPVSTGAEKAVPPLARWSGWVSPSSQSVSPWDWPTSDRSQTTNTRSHDDLIGARMSRRFEHSPEIWTDFPQLVPGVLLVQDITHDIDLSDSIGVLGEVAAARLGESSEGEFPEVQAWRKAFAQMGLKPTQYRCASESLLRRYRKEGSLPRLHPLVDLCNAASLAFALPVAAFDTDLISGNLRVRYARGDENYLNFSGSIEHPQPGEVVFADSAGHAHSRRWTHRQSRSSAVSDTTRTALIVTEALHDTGRESVGILQETLVDILTTVWHTRPQQDVLSRPAPTFTFPS